MIKVTTKDGTLFEFASAAELISLWPHYKTPPINVALPVVHVSKTLTELQTLMLANSGIRTPMTKLRAWATDNGVVKIGGVLYLTTAQAVACENYFKAKCGRERSYRNPSSKLERLRVGTHARAYKPNSWHLRIYDALKNEYDDRVFQRNVAFAFLKRTFTEGVNSLSQALSDLISDGTVIRVDKNAPTN